MLDGELALRHEDVGAADEQRPRRGRARRRIRVGPLADDRPPAAAGEHVRGEQPHVVAGIARMRRGAVHAATPAAVGSSTREPTTSAGSGALRPVAAPASPAARCRNVSARPLQTIVSCERSRPASVPRRLSAPTARPVGPERSSSSVTASSASRRSRAASAPSRANSAAPATAAYVLAA
jgi:hypothetical protein